MNEEKKYLKISEKMLKPILIGLCIILFGFAMLQLGINIGSNHGRSFCNWAKNYQNNFGGPKNGFGIMPERPFIHNYGVFGEIVAVNGQQVVIHGQDQIERIVNIDANTKISSFRGEVNTANFKINDRIMIIGEANEQGQIDAKLIRIFNRP